MPVNLTFSGVRARLTFEGPHGNALTVEMIEAMRRGLAEAASRNGVRLLTIEGGGADFCYGSSIEEHLPGLVASAVPVFHALIRHLVSVPVPTAAVVRGRCLGGGFEMALACDFIFATDDAQFGLPEIKLGLFPPVGAVLLPMRLGASRAAFAILTGEPRPAATWRDAGLIEAVVPARDLDTALATFVSLHLAPRSVVALSHAARASRLAIAHAIETLLPASERLYLESLMRTRDAEEGVRAFLEKRAPRWKEGAD
jgi:cyclohexa-1,5-dienecarbonyl-CoA hydratase